MEGAEANKAMKLTKHEYLIGKKGSNLLLTINVLLW